MKKLLAAIILAIAANGTSYARSASDFGITPFLVYGDHFSLGVESNRWWMLLDPGWSKETAGNPLMSRLLFAGYGFRLFYDYSERRSNDDRMEQMHGVYLSPMASIYYIAFGLSVSPDIGLYGKNFDYGVSARAWFLLFGTEIAWSKKRSPRFGFYLYLPIYSPAGYYI